MKTNTKRNLCSSTLLFLVFLLLNFCIAEAAPGDIITVAANLSLPTGVAVDGAGNIYIADTLQSRIWKVSASNGIVTSVAGNGSYLYDGDGGAATLASLYSPTGVAVDYTGGIYIADSGNNRIRKVNSFGIITTVAGNGSNGYTGDGISAISASLNYPGGVAVDSAGNIYFADKNNNRIRKVTASTGIITTVAGNGSNGYTGDGVSAISASLNYPGGIAVDSAGNIYIADTYNSRIRKVTASTGIITTVAGNGSNGYTGDGVSATLASLYYPGGVAMDSVGNIYIADSLNNRIRMVTAAPMVQSGNELPVYQFYNASLNNYLLTISEDEKNALIQNPQWNWVLKGTAFYAYNSPEPNTLPVSQFFNAELGGYYYTISEDEKNALIQNPQWNWVLKGTAFYAYNSPSPNIWPVYLFYNEELRSYFFTISADDKDLLLKNPQGGWALKGTSFYAYNSASANTLPVHRFNNALLGGYFFTISEGEKNALIQNPQWNWTLQGIGFYAYASQAPGTLPVYHFYNDTMKSYYLTISEGEKNSLLQNPQWGWTLRNTAFYAYSSQEPNTVPVYEFYNTALGGYLYTASEDEKNDILQHPEWQWVFKRTAFYAYESPAGGPSVNSTPLDNWHWRSPQQGPTSDLKGVSFGKGTFVAVGSGIIMISPDGTSWTVSLTDPDKYFNGVAYGGELFIAVGQDQHFFRGFIATSPDGVNWTFQDPVSSISLYGISYGNGTFVAVGHGTIATSPDGKVWTVTYALPQGPYGVVDDYNGVAYGSDIFVIAGSRLLNPGYDWHVALQYQGLILTSSDGVAWTPRDVQAGHLNSVACGNNLFVAVAGSTSGGLDPGLWGGIVTSGDGIIWTSRQGAADKILNAVTYGNGTFLAVGWEWVNTGTEWTYGATMLTSSDGANWTPRESGFMGLLNSAAFGNNTFVVVGNGGAILQSDPVK